MATLWLDAYSPRDMGEAFLCADYPELKSLSVVLSCLESGQVSLVCSCGIRRRIPMGADMKRAGKLRDILPQLPATGTSNSIVHCLASHPDMGEIIKF